jgi:hypothetical protein
LVPMQAPQPLTRLPLPAASSQCWFLPPLHLDRFARGATPQACLRHRDRGTKRGPSPCPGRIPWPCRTSTPGCCQRCCHGRGRRRQRRKRRAETRRTRARPRARTRKRTGVLPRRRCRTRRPRTSSRRCRRAEGSQKLRRTPSPTARCRRRRTPPPGRSRRSRWSSGRRSATPAPAGPGARSTGRLRTRQTRRSVARAAAAAHPTREAASQSVSQPASHLLVHGDGLAVRPCGAPGQPVSGAEVLISGLPRQGERQSCFMVRGQW